jgi:hypothetical protein
VATLWPVAGPSVSLQSFISTFRPEIGISVLLSRDRDLTPQDIYCSRLDFCTENPYNPITVEESVSTAFF